jgi:deoxyadenosine/deoxycytidine kinase
MELKERELQLDSTNLIKQSSRVELVGPPGVGKTALYKALIKASNNQVLVSLAHASKEEYSVNRFSDKIIHLLKRIFRCEIEQSFRIIDLEQEGVQEWNKYLDNILLDLSGKGFDFDKRKTLFWILRNLNNAVLAEKYFNSVENGNKYVLLDKGALALAENASKGWNLCPMPALAIFLECRPETIAERILNRKQANFIHRDKNYQQLVESSGRSLSIHRNGARVLKQRGGMTTFVNSENSLETLTNDVLNILKQVQNVPQKKNQFRLGKNVIEPGYCGGGRG